MHRSTSQLLQKGNPQPTEINCDILHLYNNPDDVSIVTTNFDMLLEQADPEIHNLQPK